MRSRSGAAESWSGLMSCGGVSASSFGRRRRGRLRRLIVGVGGDDGDLRFPEEDVVAVAEARQRDADAVQDRSIRAAEIFHGEHAVFEEEARVAAAQALIVNGEIASGRAADDQLAFDDDQAARELTASNAKSERHRPRL